MREFRERRRKERVEGGQKERRERPVSSVSRRAVRVPLSPGSGRRLAVFSPATRKKNSSISASATCNRCSRRHSRGETGRPLPTRGTPRSPAEQRISALSRPRPTAASQGRKKKRALSRLLPRKSGFCLGASPNQCRLSPRRLSTFRNVKRSKMSRRRLRVEGCGAKEDATERFPKGRAEGQPADKC